MTYEAVFKQLQSEGKSYNEIRAITGASKGTISHWLGKGQKQKTSQRRQTLRAVNDSYIQHLKETTPCEDCGHYYNYWNMQFDHLPKFTKSFNISNYRTHTQNLDRIKQEIAKCELVCGNCHSDRGHFRRIEDRKLKALYEDALKNGHEDFTYEVFVVVPD